MPLEHKDISQIEAYLTQQMAAKDRMEFEQRLQESTGLQHEVEVYRSLLFGFEALQEEDLHEQIKTWELSWTEATEEDADLIEWYFQGQLGEEAKAKVIQRIQVEPAFAKKVADYRELFEGFHALGEASFASNLKKWEREKPSRSIPGESPQAKVRPLRPILVRIAAAAVILLLLGVGLQQYMQSQYSDQALVADYYQNPGDNNLMGSEKPAADEVTLKFRNAHQLLEKQNFTGAELAFKNLLAELDQLNLDPLTRQYLKQNAEWNYTLALLGTDQEDQVVLSSLEAIIANPDHEYQKKATELKRKLNSFWR